MVGRSSRVNFFRKKKQLLPGCLVKSGESSGVVGSLGRVVSLDMFLVLRAHCLDSFHDVDHTSVLSHSQSTEMERSC